MMDTFSDMQRLSQTNVANALQVWGDWNRNMQSIASEVGNYQRRSLEDGTEVLHRLMAAKSIEQAFEIQTTYARRAYQTYLDEMNKIGGLYAGMARDAMRPLEKMGFSKVGH